MILDQTWSVIAMAPSVVPMVTGVRVDSHTSNDRSRVPILDRQSSHSNDVPRQTGRTDRGVTYGRAKLPPDGSLSDRLHAGSADRGNAEESEPARPLRRRR